MTINILPLKLAVEREIQNRRVYTDALTIIQAVEGLQQCERDLEKRLAAQRAEVAKIEAHTIDAAKAQAAKIIEDANNRAKLAAVEGHDHWKNNLAKLQAEIAEKRAELATVEKQIADLRAAAKSFAGA